MNKSPDQLCATCPIRILIEEGEPAAAPAPDESYVAPDCQGPAVATTVGSTTLGELVIMDIRVFEVCGRDAEDLMSRQRPAPPFSTGGPGDVPPTFVW